VAHLRRYVVLMEGAAEVIALWIVHTYLLDNFGTSPRLAITSPEKNCGKNTLLDVIVRLVWRALPTANASTAAVFRVVEMKQPTLLIDEADTFLRQNDELRGILNSGHRRGGSVIRTVGEDHEPRKFSTYSACAIAMIGRLPGTLADRSVPIELRRRRADEPIEPFRFDRTADLDELARKVARWAKDNAGRLGADPEMPDGVFNRVEDNWRPLLAIADAAGGEWPARAREALECAIDAADGDDQSVRVQLLSDIRAIFAKTEGDRLSSTSLVDALVAIEDRPWAEWGKTGKPLTKNGLARVKAFDDLSVKFYGTLDVNYYCQDKGTQAPGDLVPAYFLFANTMVGPNSLCSIGSNGMSVSNMGFTVEKPIGYGITAIGRAETFFSPLTGQVLNGVGTVAKGNTMVFGNQVAYGDSNSAGQFLNGDVYAGLSSQQLGTVTVGRLKSLNFDDFLLYDPFAQSLAFSMIGYYGGGAGSGDTEDRRWDNSAKWVWDGGVFHVAAQGSTGCNDCGQQGAWGVDVGLRNVLGGFSIDGAYLATKDAVSAPGILLGQGAGGTPAPLPGVSLTNQLLARISDNKEWTVQAKYVWNLPGWGSPGMYTKAAPTPATFTLYGGWLHIEFRDPTNPLSNGQTTLGNYVIGVANNFRYETPQVQDWFWAGGKYAVNQWTFTGAYYYQQHNTFVAGLGLDNAAVNAGIGNVQQPTGVSICIPPP